MKTKITALILSGGGAKGAFQIGVEKYAREVKGYHWDIISGVSVGALNAGMLAMGKTQRLFELWNNLQEDQITRGRLNFISIIKLLLGKKAYASNKPLQDLIADEFEPEKIICDLRVGSVSLVSGEYIRFRTGYPKLAEAVLASTALPLVWEPVDLSPECLAMVDGGIRNITPIGDVLDTNPDEIIIINCSPQAPTPLLVAPKNAMEIGLRSIDLMMNEIFQNDQREFLRINALVKEAAEYGVILHHPGSGRAYKSFRCHIIEPTSPLGDTLDFSQEAIQHSLRMGIKRAREVLGR